jgi:hypothetical protein
MARQYERAEGEEGGCPGEESCHIWRSSAEDSKVRCPSCPKRLTQGDGRQNSAEILSETFDERQLLDRVDRFRKERDAGRRVYEWMSPLEWEAMLIWDETFADYQRGYQVQTLQLMSHTVELLMIATKMS